MDIPPPVLPDRLIGISTKMYFDLPTTADYIQEMVLNHPEPPSSKCGLFFIPTFPSLPAAMAYIMQAPHIMLGGQNCHWEDSGAHTGEVSPLVLKQLGCSIVELGHAERRKAPFNESDELIATKAAAAWRNGLIPLVCIGEQQQSQIISEGVGMAVKECVPQVLSVLDELPDDADIIFAYEPVWAIGAQAPASADHVLAVVGALREVIQQTKVKGQLRILYGGSAGPGTWKTLKSGLDGLFLGRFAHDKAAYGEVVAEVA
ncbi:hypothetical protein MMC20_001782 [Loxospora ochrophaea]|nr:hypothetical protein [Loxospora ochrophaea]